MDFSFGRQSLLQKSESLKSSLSGGSSRLRNSASDVKTGFFGGITSMQSKIEGLSNKIGGSLDIEEKQPDVDQADAAMQRPKQRPKKPPLPKRISDASLNGSVKQFNSNDNTQYAEDLASKKRVRAPSAGEAINFDEPLYDRRDVIDAGGHTNRGDPAASYPQNTVRTGRTGIQNPFMTDNVGSLHEYNTVTAEVHSHGTTYGQTAISSNEQQEPPRPDLMQRRQTNPFIDIDDSVNVRTNGSSVSQDTTGFGSDLLPGIPRVPSQPNTDFLDPMQRSPQDLFAITPTSGEALPMPGIDPSPVEEGEVIRKYRDPDEIYDDSDGDSEATEGCDDIQDDDEYLDHPMGGEEGGGRGDMLNSGSMSSDLSWCSSDSNMDELSKDCMQFMKEYVAKIFDNSKLIGAVDKSRFGEMCQHEAGRLWFARYINIQRVNKKVSEQTFFQLVQYFAIVLFESNDHEDYGPAKTLMNMCFTYYHEDSSPGILVGPVLPPCNITTMVALVQIEGMTMVTVLQEKQYAHSNAQLDHPTGPSYKHFLYSYLKDQPIWQSIKFWNAAFFDAVMSERSRPIPQNNSGASNESEYQENIVFGQLGTFTCNMRAFGLSKELCLDFLRKQSSIVNLREEQLQMLKDNIERSPESFYGKK